VKIELIHIKLTAAKESIFAPGDHMKALRQGPNASVNRLRQAIHDEAALQQRAQWCVRIGRGFTSQQVNPSGFERGRDRLGGETIEMAAR
jgi:hypothetical protein